MGELVCLKGIASKEKAEELIQLIRSFEPTLIGVTAAVLKWSVGHRVFRETLRFQRRLWFREFSEKFQSSSVSNFSSDSYHTEVGSVLVRNRSKTDRSNINGHLIREP